MSQSTCIVVGRVGSHLGNYFGNVLASFWVALLFWQEFGVIENYFSFMLGTCLGLFRGNCGGSCWCHQAKWRYLPVISGIISGGISGSCGDNFMVNFEKLKGAHWVSFLWVDPVGVALE